MKICWQSLRHTVTVGKRDDFFHQQHGASHSVPGVAAVCSDVVTLFIQCSGGGLLAMTDPKNVDMGAKIELAGLVLQLCFFQCLRASPSTSIAAASAMDLPNSRAHVRCWLPVCLHGPTDCAQHILFSGVCAGIQWWVSPLEILRGRAPDLHAAC